MKKTLIVMLSLALSGCVTKFVPEAAVDTDVEIVIDGSTIGKAEAPKMPPLPASLAVRAERLPPLVDRTVAGQQREAAETDRKYNEVSHRLNNVIQAWGCVMKLLNERKDASSCFKE